MKVLLPRHIRNPKIAISDVAGKWVSIKAEYNLDIITSLIVDIFIKCKKPFKLDNKLINKVNIKGFAIL
jgi:hypothetical protein